MKAIRFLVRGGLAVLALMFWGRVNAQQGPSAEDLFQQARHVAFDAHDYLQAKAICRKALALSPTDPDIRIFLGRLYAWDHQADSARVELGKALEAHPGYEDGCVAWSDLEFWNDHSQRALDICLMGLQFHPGSQPLRQRKAKLLADLHRYWEARVVADSLVAENPKDADARSLIDKIKDYSAGNKVGVTYDYVYFDKQYADPWHLASLEFSHPTALGSVIGWVNYANRFRTGGVQFEGEAYPHISKTFYGYLDLGYSPDQSLFPKYRGGASLYANLPHAFEADGGFRYLYFGSATWLYTFSVGKYYKNYWFNARTYLVPGNSGTSQSLTLTGRYYNGGADDYFSLALGTGISPDDRTNNYQLADPYKLRSKKVDGGWRHAFHKLNIFYIDVQWLYQEYLPETHGNQVDIGVGYLRRF